MFKISVKTWKRSTYGMVRAEIIGALINSVFLLALCFSIFTEAVQRVLKGPEEIQQPKWVLGVGAIGLVINLIGIAVFLCKFYFIHKI